jgi:hypothetical protein
VTHLVPDGFQALRNLFSSLQWSRLAAPAKLATLICRNTLDLTALNTIAANELLKLRPAGGP